MSSSSGGRGNRVVAWSMGSRLAVGCSAAGERGGGDDANGCPDDGPKNAGGGAGRT
jgi:hypothetical protein